MRGKEETWLDLTRSRVCLCCHVRTGTIVLGIWHLLMELVLIGLLLIALIRPDVMVNNTDNGSVTIYNNAVHVGSDGNKLDVFTYFRTDHINQDQMSMMLIMTLIFFVATIILIYGAIRYKSGYLMPFFCIQVFYFCLACLTAVGFFSYMPSVKTWIHQRFDDRIALKNDLLAMDDSLLMVLLCTLFVLALAFKAYLINVVWSCYTYIHKRNLIKSVNVGDDGEMALPPKYEDAIRLPVDESNLAPPPPYSQ